MELKFKIVLAEVTKTKYFNIQSEDSKYEILENFTSHDWTTELAQEIIDGVEASRAKPKENPYEWANEDVELNANENGVWLYDWSADRGGETNPLKLNLILTHDEFIQFMTDFKQFIENNQ